MTYLFTIVCEYKGGTYTKQLSAEDPVRAFEQWAVLFGKEDVLSASEKQYFADEVRHSLSGGNMVALEGLLNVWYEGFSLGDDLLEVTIIAMSGHPIPFAQMAGMPEEKD